MPDEIDRAVQEEERFLAQAIRRASSSGLRMPPTGRCYYCEEITSDSDRWCSVECRDDWQREADLRQRGLR